MRNKDLRSKNWHLMFWRFLFCLSAFTFVLFVGTLGWVEMGFFIKSEGVVPFVAVPKYTQFLGFTVMVSGQKGKPSYPLANSQSNLLCNQLFR